MTASDPWKAAAALARILGYDWTNALATTIAGATNFEDFTRRVRDTLPSSYVTATRELENPWVAAGMAPKELAAALRGAAEAQAFHRATDIEISWTGPESDLVPARRTEQVLQQVIDRATKRLLLVSYIFVNPGGLAERLRAAHERGVSIEAIFEPPYNRGGGRESVKIDSAANLRNIVPEARCFEWSREDKQKSGRPDTAVLHAKAAIADDRAALITSANLTGSAMETNIEVGVLITDPLHVGPLRSLFGQFIEHGHVSLCDDVRGGRGSL